MTPGPSDIPPHAGRPVPTGRILAIGEVLLRLSAPRGQTIETTHHYHVHVGGAEANVLAALSRWHHPTRLMTCLPAGGLGHKAVETLLAAGVDVAAAPTTESVMGSYLHEAGEGPRAARVQYRRASSAFARWDARNVSWPSELEDASWLHATGITPALSNRARESLRTGMHEAHRLGIPISLDLNYRPQLWDAAEAARTLEPLIADADILITNEQDPRILFGVDASGGEELARALVRRWPHLQAVALSLHTARDPAAAPDTVIRGAGILARGGWCASPMYRVHRIDDIGAGDAFAAGLIHGTLSDLPLPDRITFAAAAACLKMRRSGDMLLCEVEDVWNVVRGMQRLEDS